MSNELISRSAVKDIAAKYGATDDFDMLIDQIPAVDAAPVRHGKWAHLGGDEWCCTACGDVIHTEGSWEKPTKKYCSECGAKMDGDSNG